MSSNFNPQFAKLGEILIHNGKATENGVNEALAQQKSTNEKLGITLIEMGFIEEDDLQQHSVYNWDIEKLIFVVLEADSDVASLVPEDFTGKSSSCCQ